MHKSEVTMMKAVALLLMLTLTTPHLLYATPEPAVTPSAGGTDPAAQPANVPPASDYSPTAAKTYLGTGIGTLLAGSTLIVLGKNEADKKDITSDAASNMLYVIGGTFLAASTVLWILYFRETGKEPPATVGVDMSNGRYGLVAKFSY